MRRRSAAATPGADMVVLSVEVHAITRGKLLPDPKHDAVCCIAVAELVDGDRASHVDAYDVSLFLLARNVPAHGPLGLPPTFDVRCFGTEVELLRDFIALVQRIDPDVIFGFETQHGSIGYLSDRLDALQAAAAPSLPVPVDMPPPPPRAPLVRDMDPTELAQKLREQSRAWEEEQARKLEEEERKRRASGVLGVRPRLRRRP